MTHNKVLYDYLIVGKGLIGSAAGKYLSYSSKQVAIVGPDEPFDFSTSQVFASHYDNTRVQRCVGKDSIWTRLNIESIQQYDQLQQESGIHFHSDEGCLYVSPHGEDNYLKSYVSLAAQFQIAHQHLPDIDSIHAAFPFYSFQDSACGVFEPGPAGHINPRLLLQAQLTVFQKNNGTVFRDTVNSIDIKRAYL